MHQLGPGVLSGLAGLWVLGYSSMALVSDVGKAMGGTGVG